MLGHLALAALVALILVSPLTADPPAAKKRALLVGVSTYHNGGFAGKPLSYPAPDMELLAQELKTGGWEVTLLLSRATQDAATRSGVTSALNRVLESVEPGDIVLVALSGYGQQCRAWIEIEENKLEGREEVFFCPSDAAAGDTRTMLGITCLMRTLATKGGTNLVLLDAGRTDANRRSVGPFRVLDVPDNTSVLFGSSAGQQSFETNQMYGKDSEKGHGIFSYRVWKGLQGEAHNAAGEVTWDSLTEYVRTHVNDDAARWFPEWGSGRGRMNVQTPQLIGNLSGKPSILASPRVISARP